MMTGKQLQAASISIANTMMGMGYSQFTIEAVMNSITAIMALQREQVPMAVSKYQELLKQNLPEDHFYTKMSQVFKEAVGIH